MTLPVRSTPEAELQILEIDGWWRRNRDASPNLFLQELTAAFDIVGDAPYLGRLYQQSPIPGTRRVLLKGTRYHVYVPSANAWLAEIEKFLERNPVPFPIEILKVRARNAFAARIQYWKLETRRYRALQVAAVREAGAKPETTVGPEIKERRKLLVSRYRKAHNLTAVGLGRKVGISDSGIRGIVNEDTTRFSEANQLKLLEILNVTREDWYRL